MTAWKLAVVLVVLAGPARPSSVVAISDGGSVAVAADDLMRRGSRYSSECKLRIVCGRIFGVTGLGLRDLSALDVGADIVCATIDRDPDIAAESVAEAYAGIIYPEILKEPNGPGELKKSPKLVEVVVVGWAGERPSVARSTVFQDVNGGTGTTTQTRYAVSCAIGSVEAIAAVREGIQPLAAFVGNDNAAALLVALEHHARPDLVGCLVSVACVDASGARWLARGPCEDGESHCNGWEEAKCADHPLRTTPAGR